MEPVSLTRDISPPAKRRTTVEQPSLAAIEAGEAEIQDHLEFFTSSLRKVGRPNIGPRITIEQFRELYRRNQHEHGNHFVIHQHDHPISGVHYDLRLQFSDTSSISFAVPYGMPGNPNSVRPNRMAIETRVHNVWNHLIESASHATGSLLIWDTGTYEVVGREVVKEKTTDDEASENEGPCEDSSTQSERLFSAFQSRHIRLRLKGSRLPAGYTVALRLPKANNKTTQPRKPKIKRRRVDPTKAARFDKGKDPQGTSDSNGSSDEGANGIAQDGMSVYEPDVDAAVASEGEGEADDATIRVNNAYPGSTNTIGSIHQRHWFLTLDRKGSGFYRANRGPDAGRWVGPWEAFYVRGRDHETSIVTGRMADDVMEDEGVAQFVGRKMWRPILE